jgi:hypothetical protein
MSLFWKLTWLLALLSGGSELEIAASLGANLASYVCPWGFQTWCPEEGLTLPSPTYLKHPPQYFPPSPAYPVPEEVEAQETEKKQTSVEGLSPWAPSASPMNAASTWIGSPSCSANKPHFLSHRTQVRFEKPAAMQVTWLTTDAESGSPRYSTPPLYAPAKYNFEQGAIYRLKLTDIRNRPDGFAVYPSLEIVPSTESTSEFLAHNYLPLELTDEDFDLVVDGNYVVKVIYLPDGRYGEARPKTISSHRLEAGVDPIAEAQRRGNILAVIRLGTIDGEAPGAPPLDSDQPQVPQTGAATIPCVPVCRPPSQPSPAELDRP